MIEFLRAKWRSDRATSAPKESPEAVAQREREAEDARLEAEYQQAAVEELARQAKRGEGPWWSSGSGSGRLRGDERQTILERIFSRWR